MQTHLSAGQNSPMWQWVAGLAIGAAGSLGGVWLGALLSNRSQDRPLKTEQERLFARLRFDRLRDLYGRLAQSAATIQAVMYESKFTTVAESVEQRDKRHEAMLIEAQRVVAEVGGPLLVEPSVEEVRDKYTELRSKFDLLLAIRGQPPSPTRSVTVVELEKELSKLALGVTSLARRHLVRLDIPPQITQRAD